MGDKLKSRKLWTLIVGGLINVINGMMATPMDEATLDTLNKLAAVYILGQGFADGVSGIAKK